jgi:3-oxoacyl-[acyl-carrier-protein] synthase-3
MQRRKLRIGAPQAREGAFTAQPVRTELRAGIAGIGTWVPDRIVTNEEIEQRITEASAKHGFVPRPGVVGERTGIVERRFSDPSDDASDIAVRAARVALEDARVDISQIDLIIFASSSQDLIEPATAHIVSSKLGATAMVFDVKNACNSFIQGMQIADALIRTGQHRRILVCTGEKPSAAIRWELRDWEHMKESFACYTFGDAGAAVVLEPRSDGTGLGHIDFVAASKNWEICTVRAGGTMHFRDLDHTYFAGDGNSLRDAFVELGPQLIVDTFQATGTTFDDYDVILFHQVTTRFLDVFHDVSGVPRSKIMRTVDTLGNIASATLPLQLERARAEGIVKPGSRVLWIGLGAGISLGVMTMRM